MHLDQHISQQFNSDLEALRSAMLAMGGMVENQLKNAADALQEANLELADKVLQAEKEVNEHEVAIDAQCTEILARRQPAASDLRLVLTVTKAIRDLERVGDESCKIARMAIDLSESKAGTEGLVEVRHLASNVQKMLNSSLDAFARFDALAAVKVMRQDKHIDREYKSAMREMVTLMMEDPRSISRVLSIIWALRSLERIGDHARNVAEHLIYLVRGTDVRHVSAKKVEKQLTKENNTP